MAVIVSDSTDFMKVMSDCLTNFGDSSVETRDARVKDWLWLTKNNHTINQSDISMITDDEDKSDIREIMHEVSNFVNKTDKEVICLYMIMEYPKYIDEIKLDENLVNESMNLDNSEVNAKINTWTHTWVVYDQAILKKELKDMSDVIGPDVINDINASAPRCFIEESVGNLQKQLSKRGYDRLDNWDELYDKLKSIKEQYRFSLRNKKSILFQKCSLSKLMSEHEFDIKAYVLRDSIKSNLDNEGVKLNGRIQ